MVGAGCYLQASYTGLKGELKALERVAATNATNIANSTQEIALIEDTAPEEAVVTRLHYLARLKASVQILQQEDELEQPQISIIKLEMIAERALQRCVRKLHDAREFPAQVSQITVEIKSFVTQFYVLVCNYFERQLTCHSFAEVYGNHESTRELSREQRGAIIENVKSFVKTLK